MMKDDGSQKPQRTRYFYQLFLQGRGGSNEAPGAAESFWLFGVDGSNQHRRWRRSRAERLCGNKGLAVFRSTADQKLGRL